jgi:hypothetical protein
MGLESDQEIVQLIGVEPAMTDLFSGSLEEPYNIGVYSQQQAGSHFPIPSSFHIPTPTGP